MSLIRSIIEDFERLEINDKQSIENVFGEITNDNLRSLKHTEKDFISKIIKWVSLLRVQTD